MNTLDDVMRDVRHGLRMLRCGPSDTHSPSGSCF